MDPITHAIIGAGIAGLSGGEMSLANQVVLAAMAGSVAPDLDIVYQFKGDMAYLKTHRGFSHSIPGLIMLSGLIAGAIGLAMPGAGFWHNFAWAFAGTLSHTLLDLLNSYGAQIFAPFNRKKYSGNLLMITDPVLLLLFIPVFFLPGNVQWNTFLAFLGLGGYLWLRFCLRKRAERYLANKYAHRKLERLAVMPSMLGLWTWDFVVETEHKCLVGQINSFNFGINIRRKLAKFNKVDLLEAALESKLGKLFKEFTPHFHLVINKVNDNYVVDFLDLRYLLKKDFLHTGTAVFDRRLQLVKAFFHPYSRRRKIDLGA